MQISLLNLVVAAFVSGVCAQEPVWGHPSQTHSVGHHVPTTTKFTSEKLHSFKPTFSIPKPAHPTHKPHGKREEDRASEERLPSHSHSHVSLKPTPSIHKPAFPSHKTKYSHGHKFASTFPTLKPTISIHKPVHPSHKPFPRAEGEKFEELNEAQAPPPPGTTLPPHRPIPDSEDHFSWFTHSQKHSAVSTVTEHATKPLSHKFGPSSWPTKPSWPAKPSQKHSTVSTVTKHATKPVSHKSGPSSSPTKPSWLAKPSSWPTKPTRSWPAHGPKGTSAPSSHQ